MRLVVFVLFLGHCGLSLLTLALLGLLSRLKVVEAMNLVFYMAYCAGIRFVHFDRYVVFP